MTLDHVAIAVRDLQKAVEFYGKAFRLSVTHQEEVPEQKVRIVFLGGPEGAIELLEPMEGNESLTRFLDKNGPGLHHLAFKTDSLGAQMRRLSGIGLSPIEREERPGSRGTRVCFIHPRKTGGVLVELVGANGK